MTVHHLPKPIPDGDPNHQSRNFLVPGRSTPRPSHSCTPTCRGSQRGGGERHQPPWSLSLPHTVGTLGAQDLRGFVGAGVPPSSFLPRKCVLGELGPPLVHRLPPTSSSTILLPR